MTNGTPKPTDSEICSIRIMFPVESDEKAIEYKRKISEILSDVEGVRIEFGIMSSPIGMPPQVR